MGLPSTTMFPSTKAQSLGHCPWTESYLARYAEDSPAPGNSLMWTNSNSGWSYARRNARRPMRPKPGRLTGRLTEAIDRQSWAPRSLFTDDRGGGAGFDPWGRWAPRVDAGRSGRRCVRTVDANLDHDIRAWIHALWEVRRVGLRFAKKNSRHDGKRNLITAGGSLGNPICNPVHHRAASLTFL